MRYYNSNLGAYLDDGKAPRWVGDMRTGIGTTEPTPTSTSTATPPLAPVAEKPAPVTEPKVSWPEPLVEEKKLEPAEAPAVAIVKIEFAGAVITGAVNDPANALPPLPAAQK